MGPEDSGRRVNSIKMIKLRFGKDAEEQKKEDKQQAFAIHLTVFLHFHSSTGSLCKWACTHHHKLNWQRILWPIISRGVRK